MNPYHLTNREMEVLRALCETPETQACVAESLGISRDTVARHLTNICRKTGTDSRQHLAYFAWAKGLACCPCGKGSNQLAIRALENASSGIAECLKRLKADEAKR